MKKLTTLFLLALLSVSSAWADVVINETNFPDENFRSYLKSLWYGLDGVITDKEISRVTSIGINNQGIQSLKGIEFFTALSKLIYYDNEPSMTSIDLSKNTALTFLSIGGTLIESIDLSNNTALTSLYIDSNKLTSLDVSRNTALTTITCFSNQLTSLDLSQNTALERVDCYKNQIKGEDMDALVANLPARSGRYGNIMVISSKDEGNVMTTTQVAAAKAKGWTPRYYDGSNWLEYAGSEPAEPSEKCATPTIVFAGGKLQFSCDTEDVEYVSHVEMPTSFDSNSDNVTLPTIKVTVYAKKEGYENSDVATKEINVGGSGGVRGDVNLDGEVGMPDVMFIVNYILNGEFPEE